MTEAVESRDLPPASWPPGRGQVVSFSLGPWGPMAGTQPEGRRRRDQAGGRKKGATSSFLRRCVLSPSVDSWHPLLGMAVGFAVHQLRHTSLIQKRPRRHTTHNASPGPLEARQADAENEPSTPWASSGPQSLLPGCVLTPGRQPQLLAVGNLGLLLYTGSRPHPVGAQRKGGRYFPSWSPGSRGPSESQWCRRPGIALGPRPRCLAAWG